MDVNRYSTLAAVAALGSTCWAPAFAGSFVYQVVSVPGQSQCYLSAINTSQQAVGSCIQTGKTYVGLTMNAGTPQIYSLLSGFVTVNRSGIALAGHTAAAKPSMTYTLVNVATGAMHTVTPKIKAIPNGFAGYSMNNSKTIVGQGYGKSGTYVPIVIQGARVTVLDPPNAAPGTGGLTAINNPGTVGGFYLDQSNGPHTYTYQSGTYSVFDPSHISSITAIADDGAVLEANGDLFQNGSWMGVVPPGARSFSVGGIGPGDEVVGSFMSESATTWEGYIERDGSYYFINVPGFSNTLLAGVDANGDVVGSVWNKSQKQSSAFIAICPAGQAPCTQ